MKADDLILSLAAIARVHEGNGDERVDRLIDEAICLANAIRSANAIADKSDKIDRERVIGRAVLGAR